MAVGVKIKTALSQRFRFKNFAPESDLEHLINSRLHKLSDIVLDETTITGLLERMGIGYRCRLQAVSSQGPIITEALANDPRSAVLRLGKRLDEAFFEGEALAS